MVKLLHPPTPHTPAPRRSAILVDDQEKRINEEIEQLKRDIRRVGTAHPNPEPRVLFGELFDDEFVEQYYEALVGTLKSAKKRGVITFKGQMLFKGMHDNVLISIVDESSPPHKEHHAEEGKVKEEISNNSRPRARQSFCKKNTGDNTNGNGVDSRDNFNSRPQLQTTKRLPTFTFSSPEIKKYERDGAAAYFRDSISSYRVETGASKRALNSYQFDPAAQSRSAEKMQPLLTGKLNYNGVSTSVGSSTSTSRQEEKTSKAITTPTKKEITQQIKNIQPPEPIRHTTNNNSRVTIGDTAATRPSIVQGNFPVDSCTNNKPTTKRKPKIVIEGTISTSSSDQTDRLTATTLPTKTEDSPSTDMTIASAPAFLMRKTQSQPCVHAKSVERVREENHTASAGLAFQSRRLSQQATLRVDEEIKQLLVDIRRVGCNPGEPHVTFGELFDDDSVQQYYEALVGTLKSAKRRGYVTFKGQMLLKGMHDKVKIQIVEKYDEKQ